MLENYNIFNKVAPLIKTSEFRLIPDPRMPEGIFTQHIENAKQKNNARTVIQRVLRRVIGKFVDEQVLQQAADIIKVSDLEAYYNYLQKKNTDSDGSLTKDNGSEKKEKSPRTKLCNAINAKVKQVLKPIEERKSFCKPAANPNTISIYRFLETPEEKSAADMLQNCATTYYPDKYALGVYYSSKSGSFSHRIFIDNFPIYCKNIPYIIEASKVISGLGRYTTVAEFIYCISTDGIEHYNVYIAQMNQAINQYKQQNRKWKCAFGSTLMKNLCVDKEIIEIRECTVREIGDEIIKFNDNLHNAELSNFGYEGHPVSFVDGLHIFANEITQENAENITLRKGFVNYMVHKDNNMLDDELVKSREYTLAELLDTKQDNLEKAGLVKFVNPLDEINEKLHFMDIHIFGIKNSTDDKMLQEHCVDYHNCACELRKIFKRFNDNRLDEVDEQFRELYNINQLFNKNFGKPEPPVEIPINFGCNSLFDGWSFTKFGNYKSALLSKNGKYYVIVCPGITPKKQFDYKDASDEANCYKMLSVTMMRLPLNIARFEEMRPYMEIEDLQERIKFILDTADKMPVFSRFHLKEKMGNTVYKTWYEFADDLSYNAASYEYKYISVEDIDKLVCSGEVYLFEIYCRDFNDKLRKNKKHKNNVNSRIFEAFFIPENQKSLSVWINAHAKIKYRPASDKHGKVVHKEKQPIACKSQKYKGRFSTRPYDIVKDRRYTREQFTLDIAFTVNNDTRKSTIKEVIDSKTDWFFGNVWYGNIIGIDRGERNLCYITVVNDNNIIYQSPMNICNDVDYNNMLDELGKEKRDSQKRFDVVPQIKNMKDGYISALVNEVVRLMIEYDAVISLENLNAGFMQGRSKIEKQVYKRIEDAIIKKLSCYIPNVTEPDETAMGGVMNPYQMVYRDEYGIHGLVFMVNPAYTSACDFNTGMRDVMPSLSSDKISTKKKKIEYLKKNFNSIRYNENTDMFEFDTKLIANLDGKNMLIESYGIRSKYNRRNRKKELYDLTVEFKKLFKKYDIPVTGNMLEYIMENHSDIKEEFFMKLFMLFKMTVQMRNTYKNEYGEEIDEIISPVRDKNGNFYKTGSSDKRIPVNADANGAYGIARKGILVVKKCIKNYRQEKDTKDINKEYFKSIMRNPVAM